MRQMFRYEIPVDEFVHPVKLTGKPHSPAFKCVQGTTAVVEFWAEHDDSIPPQQWHLQVVGTGHRIPDGARHLGTTARDAMGYVWHLYDLSFS